MYFEKYFILANTGSENVYGIEEIELIHKN
jgi:hypothetical protein